MTFPFRRQAAGDEVSRMSGAYRIFYTMVIVVSCCAAMPLPVVADDMVLFKNGRTLRADDLELEDGMYRITTMAGGVMEVPAVLVEKVISCVTDHEVEEQRATTPANPTGLAGTKRTGHSNVTKIPPAGSGGKAGSLGGKGAAGGIGAGRAGGKGVIQIPPRGGRSLQKPASGDKTKPPQKGEK